MKKVSISIVAIILVLISVFSLASCMSTVENVESVIDSVCCSDPKYSSRKSKDEVLEVIVTELEDEMDASFEGDLVAYYTFSDKSSLNYCAIFVFEKEADAKLLESRADDVLLIPVERKGCVLLAGEESLVKLLAERL